MPEISFDSIKKLTESGENFVYWIVDNIRNSNWVKLIVFIAIVVGILGYPDVAKNLPGLDVLSENYDAGY